MITVKWFLEAEEELITDQLNGYGECRSSLVASWSVQGDDGTISHYHNSWLTVLEFVAWKSRRNSTSRCRQTWHRHDAGICDHCTAGVSPVRRLLCLSNHLLLYHLEYRVTPRVWSSGILGCVTLTLFEVRRERVGMAVLGRWLRRLGFYPIHHISVSIHNVVASSRLHKLQMDHGPPQVAATVGGLEAPA